LQTLGLRDETRLAPSGGAQTSPLHGASSKDLIERVGEPFAKALAGMARERG
jgi:hypothetical protein